MGLRTGLIGLPLAVIIISLIAQTGAVSGSTSSIAFLNQSQGAATLTCTSSANPCFPNGPNSLPRNTVISCQPQAVNGIQPLFCLLWNGCPGPIPSGAYCNYLLFVFPADVQMDQGTVILVGNTGTTTSQTASSMNFNFGGIGTAGFIVIITIAVGVAVLTGLNVFGTGETPEAVHILFMSGALLGIWAALSAAEGFLTGSPASLFVQMNSALGGFGTLTYVILTLMYALGVVGTISRGS